MVDLDQQHTGVRLAAALDTLRRHWILIAVCTLAVGGITFAYSATRTKEYSSTAVLLFRDPAFDQKLFGTSFLAPSSDPQSQAATDLKLATLENVANLAGTR